MPSSARHGALAGHHHQAETVRSFPALRADLRGPAAPTTPLSCWTVLPGGDREPPPLRAAAEGACLARRRAQYHLLMRFYELHLLSWWGIGPALPLRHLRAVIEPVVNYFSPSDGGVVCRVVGEHPIPETNPIAVNSLKALLLADPFVRGGAPASPETRASPGPRAGHAALT